MSTFFCIYPPLVYMLQTSLVGEVDGNPAYKPFDWDKLEKMYEKYNSEYAARFCYRLCNRYSAMLDSNIHRLCISTNDVNLT